jgi:hypothetical protein
MFWLGFGWLWLLESSGQAIGTGFGLALAWLGLSHGLRGGCVTNLAYCRESSLELPPILGGFHVVKVVLREHPWSPHSHSVSFHLNIW